MEKELILWQQRNAVGILQLNRPEKRNAISKELLQQLNERLQQIHSDKSIKVLIIKGEREFFSSGGDLNSIMNSEGEEAELMSLNVQNIFANISRLQIPVIAQLSGLVYGGGLEMAMYCDIRIAGSNADLCLPEAHHDLIPGAGGITMLSQIMGLEWARYYLLTGAIIPLERALSFGLIHEQVEIDKLDNRCISLANELANMNPEVLKTIKTLVQENMHSKTPECLLSEAREFRSLLDRFGKEKIMQFFSSKKK